MLLLSIYETTCDKERVRHILGQHIPGLLPVLLLYMGPPTPTYHSKFQMSIHTSLSPDFWKQ